MAINFNNINLENINFNGNEVKKVNFKSSSMAAAETIWVKPYTLTRYESPGAFIDVRVLSSQDPNRKEVCENDLLLYRFQGSGDSSTSTLYYQDQLEVTYRAQDGYNLIGHSDFETISVPSVEGNLSYSCYAQPLAVIPVTCTSDAEGIVTITNYNYISVMVIFDGKELGLGRNSVVVPAAKFLDGYDPNKENPTTISTGTYTTDLAHYCARDGGPYLNSAEIAVTTSVLDEDVAYTDASDTCTINYTIRPPERVSITDVLTNSRLCHVTVYNPNPMTCQAEIVVTNEDVGSTLASEFYQLSAKTEKTFEITLNNYVSFDETVSVEISLQHASYGMTNPPVYAECSCDADTTTTAV